MFDALIKLSLRFRGFRSARVRIPGAEIHYLSRPGRPGMPTVVLVHGIGSRSIHFMDVMPALAREGYSVIVPDLPGHGESSELEATMTPDALFAALKHVLDVIAPKHFVLFGNSLGGALSLWYASERPERVSALILASPAVGFELEAEWLEMQRLLREVADGRAEGFLNRVYHRKPFYLPLLARPFRRAIRRKGILELIEHTTIAHFQLPEGMTIYPGKTLLIWGKCEALFPRILLERLRTHLGPGTVVDEPEEIGHCPHLDDPRWFNRRVIEFVELVNADA